MNYKYIGPFVPRPGSASIRSQIGKNLDILTVFFSEIAWMLNVPAIIYRQYEDNDHAVGQF